MNYLVNTEKYQSQVPRVHANILILIVLFDQKQSHKTKKHQMSTLHKLEAATFYLKTDLND